MLLMKESLGVGDMDANDWCMMVAIIVIYMYQAANEANKFHIRQIIKPIFIWRAAYETFKF